MKVSGVAELTDSQVIHDTMRMVYEVLLIAIVLIQQVKQTDPSQDLFCFRLDKNSAINCSWSPCEDTQIPMEYTFCTQEKDG
ncbi:hypothetical protein scyTo_0021675 [Scyliorhinus torazame]|uniref:Uncharacterized protein n=3 Tax=Scyliorhinus torazame TaxID=75743 RepID=A0A401QBB4_SCYTO|nr:hypothetical protein [Scyliorhinus torazame]